MDQIIVKGLRVRGRHGTTMQENTFGQEFEIDATLYVDLEKSIASDDEADTLDRRDLIQVISRTVEGTEHCDLPERLAQNIIDRILSHFPMVACVDLMLQQLQPPIVGDFDSIAVRLIRP